MVSHNTLKCPSVKLQWGACSTARHPRPEQEHDHLKITPHAARRASGGGGSLSPKREPLPLSPSNSEPLNQPWKSVIYVCWSLTQLQFDHNISICFTNGFYVTFDFIQSPRQCPHAESPHKDLRLDYPGLTHLGSAPCYAEALGHKRQTSETEQLVHEDGAQVSAYRCNTRARSVWHDCRNNRHNKHTCIPPIKIKILCLSIFGLIQHPFTLSAI